MTTGYVRFAALGDSATVGVGDPVAGGWRGWARLLAAELATSYDLSFQSFAVTGATARSVREEQLAAALTHRPTMASLVVGLNDTMRSSWHDQRFADDLLWCADALAAEGAVLLTARFHDLGEVLGLPGFVRRPLGRRVAVVNEVYAEVHRRHGGVQVDLTAAHLDDRACWSVDRLHPSERGHRQLARAFAAGLRQQGWRVELPGLAADGHPPSLLDEWWWMATQGVPWVGRRARDLGPWAVRLMLDERDDPARRRAAR